VAGTPVPFVAAQWLTNNADPATSYQLFSYEAGTTTKLNTYTDVALTVANTNPIILDSAGRATVFLSPASYKFVLASPTDTDPPASPIWTRDNVSATPPFNVNLDVTGTAGEALALNDIVYMSAGDGGRTVGRWYKADSDLTYGSIDASALGVAVTAIASAAAGSIRLSGRVTGFAGLSAGSVYYISATAGGITTSAPTNIRPIGQADSSTTLVFSPWASLVQDASTLVRGVVSTGTQSFAGNKTFAGTLTSTGLATFTAGFVSNTESTTRAGTTASTQVKLGGVFFKDVTQHDVAASQTDLVLTNTTIPANLLNTDGAYVAIEVGSSVADTGTATKTLELLLSATQIQLASFASTSGQIAVTARIVRITSTTADVMVIGGSDSGAFNCTRVTGLDYTAAITLQTLGTTPASNTFSQTFFIASLVP